MPERRSHSAGMVDQAHPAANNRHDTSSKKPSQQPIDINGADRRRGQPEQEETQHEMVDRILRERSKERALRRVNSHRMQRFAAVAKESSHYSTAGVTEDLLRQKAARHHHGDSCSDGFGPGSFARSTSSRASDTASWTTTTAVTEIRSNVSSSSQPSSDGAAGRQRRRVDRLAGGGGVRGALDDDEDEEDEDDRLLMENGGHICVVKSNYAELLLSVPGDAPHKHAPDAAPSPTPSTSSMAGAIPLSLRGLVVSRKGSAAAAQAPPPLAVASEASVPSPRCDPPQQQTIATAEAPPRMPPAASRPAPRKPNAVVWPSSSASAGQPKSILKRHPIPRKHKRRVHFSQAAHCIVEATHTLLASSSSLRLSKDGPPVAFSISDLEMMPSVQAEPQTTSGSTASGPSWGPDSTEFNREWGLRSPINTTTETGGGDSGGSVANPQPRSNAPRRTAPTKHRGRVADKGQSRAIDFLAASYHTGLSMEEARLLSAIAEVNAKLQETGFRKHHSPAEPPQPPSQSASSALPSSRPPTHAPGVPLPSNEDAAAIEERHDAPPPRPPAARLLLPEPASAGRGGHQAGGMIVDAFQLHACSQARSTSAPPAAATARNAPVPTPTGNARPLIVVPQETDVPVHVTAGLPKRKSDHQGLTRRDRFGKRMSVVGR